MNPLRLASLNASPFCLAKRGGTLLILLMINGLRTPFPLTLKGIKSPSPLMIKGELKGVQIKPRAGECMNPLRPRFTRRVPLLLSKKGRCHPHSPRERGVKPQQPKT